MHHKFLNVATLFLVALLVLTACAGGNTADATDAPIEPAGETPIPVENPAAAANANIPAELDGERFILESFGPTSNPQPPVPGSVVTIEFLAAEGRVVGSAGCNNYAADVVFDGASLTVEPPVATRRACPDVEGINEQEQVYLAALEAAQSYTLADIVLTIQYDGDNVLVFTSGPRSPEPIPPVTDDTAASAPAELANITWQLVELNGTTPLTDTQITLIFADGMQLGGSDGCNSYSGGYTIDGNTITVSQLITTLIGCMEPEGIMDQAQTYLNTLQAAQSYTLADGTLTIQSADAVLVFLAGPPPTDTGSTPTDGDTVSSVPSELVDTTWELERMGGESLIAGTEITLEFVEAGELGGSGGCNSYFGSYAGTDSDLSISGVGSTEMACMEPQA
ncbi:MAG: META domain-containing protein [Chloroflexaceae bacterium]|nr:META domain-containing protein [Chloroflexaceae bacterium]